MSFNQQNTEGYTDQELAVLNERFEAILAENGLTEEADNPTLYNWLSEQLLTDYDSEKAQASEKQEEKYYIIEHENVGPNAQPLNKWVGIYSRPGQTNMSHEEKITGWLGTTNDNASYAMGEFDSLDAARQYITDNYPNFTRDMETDTYDEELIESYRDARDVWDVKDWLANTNVIAEYKITAKTTNDELEKIADEIKTVAKLEKIYLTGDILSYLKSEKESECD